METIVLVASDANYKLTNTMPNSLRREERTSTNFLFVLNFRRSFDPYIMGCLVQVGNGIELEAVGFRFEPYRWRPCGVTWDSSRTVVVLKLRRTSALCEQWLDLFY